MICRLFVAKVAVPVAIYLEQSTHLEEQAESALDRVVGASFLVMASWATEEDPLRDIYWIVTIGSVLGLQEHGVIRSREECSVKFSRRDHVAYCISLVYDVLTSFCFMAAMWSLMRKSPDIISRCMNCAALSSILWYDDAIYEHVKFDVPGAEPLFVTLHHVCQNEVDAKRISVAAEKRVAVAHWVFSFFLPCLACAYMVL